VGAGDSVGYSDDGSVVITAGRFIASKGLSKSDWLAARRTGVTATQVAKAASGPGGFEQAVADYREDFVEQDNPYMKFGRDWEYPIARQLQRDHGILPNDWLIASEDNPRFLATPDGLSTRHDVIAEIKTTGKDWNPEKLPVQYRRQVQWQLFVTGAEMCMFAWMLREERGGVFMPAWFDAKTVIVDRDEEMIGDLIRVANQLLERLDGGG
jgi:putative phage-type endonuclease